MRKFINKIRNVYSFLPQVMDIISPLKGIFNWNDYFYDFFGFIKKKYITYHLRNGLKIKTRAHTLDKFIIVETNLHKIYTPKGFEINQKDIILDIGAHIGTFSLLAAKLANQGMVFSLEPATINFQLLRKNIKLNSLKNIFAQQIALGKSNGIALLHLDQKNTGGHSLLFENDINQTKHIKTASLLSFLKDNRIEHIDLMKMDIEGAEYQIFFDTSPDFLKSINKIALEYHQIDKKRNGKILKLFLEKHSFDVKIKQLPFASTGMLYAKKLN